MELREALSQIAEIRSAVAASESFRGYRAMPVGFAGALAVLAALVQPLLLPRPQEQLSEYLALWCSAAALSLTVAGIRILKHDWFAAHALSREVTRQAMAQFLPCLAAGLLVTLAITRHAPEIAWTLPGLWQILFSLGLFASCRLLPRPTMLVAFFYLFCGTYHLAFSQGVAAFAPWTMGIPFGLGQFALAGILYWNLERTHG